MKFCPFCGAQLVDEAAVCTTCGSAVQAAPAPAPAPVQPPVQPQYQAPVQPQYQAPVQPQYQPQPQYQAPVQPQQPSTLATVAKVLMIISTVVMGLYLLPLAWCLPMTLNYCKKIKSGEPVTTGFKVCTLLFVNTIAGILMLCDKDN